mmetsp:Transcript_3080/g.5747  ORF Transcript_3080/g.5747 Transcript_3080/m.5747 type:complete len:184 (+) Transcript_3080:273-824(+)
MKPPTNAFREALRATASGACTVLLSTGISCIFAVAIETSAHRLQYKFFPHWYDGKVKYALGLPHLQYQKLDSENIQTLNNDGSIRDKAKGSTYSDDVLETLDLYTPLHLQDDETTTSAFTSTSIQVKEDDIPMWKQDIVMKDSDFATQSTKFQSYYSDKLQEKAQWISPERVSKILLTTAMTG